LDVNQLPGSETVLLFAMIGTPSSAPNYLGCGALPPGDHQVWMVPLRGTDHVSLAADHNNAVITDRHAMLITDRISHALTIMELTDSDK
jgi:hypothetical protein